MGPVVERAKRREINFGGQIDGFGYRGIGVLLHQRLHLHLQMRLRGSILQRPGRVGIHGGQGVSDQHRQLETLASPGTQGAAE